MPAPAPGGNETAVPPSGSPADRIIEATLRLIADHGLGGVTMSAVAVAAGVARQTLYNHYPDVDAIVAEAITEHNREAEQLLKSTMQVVDTPGDRLEQLVRHLVAMGVHARHSIDYHHGLAPEVRDRVSGYDDAILRHVVAILEDGIEDGTFRADLVVDLDAVTIHHAIRGLAESAASGPDEAPRITQAGIRTLRAALQHLPNGT